MAATQGTSVWDEVVDFLLTSPTPQQIIDFHASEATQMRVRYLLDKNRNGVLTDAEKAEMEELSRVNHFVILLKARTHQKLLDK